MYEPATRRIDAPRYLRSVSVPPSTGTFQNQTKARIAARSRVKSAATALFDNRHAARRPALMIAILRGPDHALDLNLEAARIGIDARALAQKFRCARQTSVHDVSFVERFDGLHPPAAAAGCC
jgi:hypothetical protein